MKKFRSKLESRVARVTIAVFGIVSLIAAAVGPWGSGNG